MDVIEQHFHLGSGLSRSDRERLTRIEAKIDAVLDQTSLILEGASNLMTIAQDIIDAVREDTQLDTALLAALTTLTDRVDALVAEAEQTGSVADLQAALADLRANNQAVRDAITAGTPVDPGTPTEPTDEVPTEPETPTETPAEPTPEAEVPAEPETPVEPTDEGPADPPPVPADV
jgi:hypothetical protein